MSAMPERLPESLPEHSCENLPEQQSLPWADAPNEATLNRILLAGRDGIVVVAARDAHFHSSLESLFRAALFDASELEQSSKQTKPAGRSKNSSPAAHNRNPVVVIDTESVSESAVARVLAALTETVPVVLLHAEGQMIRPAAMVKNVICCLAHDEYIAEKWAAFQNTRLHNHTKLVTLDYVDAANARRMQQFLRLRNFQVVMAADRVSTTFVSSPAGNQIAMIECEDSGEQIADYIRHLRRSHESDTLGVVVTGQLSDGPLRCLLRESGADDLHDHSLSDAELLLKLQALCGRQTQVRKIRFDAYRFPDSAAYNTDYLLNVGGKLYASAQRDVITIALGVIRVTLIDKVHEAAVHFPGREEILRRVVDHCTSNLRETDLFAQSGECEFYALVTCVGRNNVSRVFGRLSSEVCALVDKASDGRMQVQLNIGVTCELGESFKSMINRAQKALLVAQSNADQVVVVN